MTETPSQWAMEEAAGTLESLGGDSSTPGFPHEQTVLARALDAARAEGEAIGEAKGRRDMGEAVVGVLERYRVAAVTTPAPHEVVTALTTTIDHAMGTIRALIDKEG